MRARATLALGLVLAAAAFPAGAPAAPPRASLPDIEDEVMCTICGTLLELSDSPQARREKAFIRERIRSGETKDQIKDDLVSEYGDEVLALPGTSGFDLTAYLVPGIGILLGIGGIGFGVLGWRRNRKKELVSAPEVKRPTGAEAERLDADLARYDL